MGLQLVQEITQISKHKLIKHTPSLPLTFTHTFTLPITDDLFYEGNETFTLTLSNANHATITGISGTIVFSDITINDNETSPQISLENTTPGILEGSGQLFLNVNLNSTLTDSITVMYETIDVRPVMRRQAQVPMLILLLSQKLN